MEEVFISLLWVRFIRRINKGKNSLLVYWFISLLVN
jgi:hypothetical protein